MQNSRNPEKRNNTVFDPLRKIRVALTPEETVRQWMISQLLELAGVPAHLAMSEAGFKFGQKQYRADILVFDRSGAPLCIVECKRPDIPIDAVVASQALRYDAVLSVRYIILTNGKKTYIYKRDGAAFVHCAQFPTYEQMTAE